MGFSFRKSINIGNGVRLNLGKKSASVSVGGKGYRYSVSTTGRRTTTFSLPGTGISYRNTSSGASATKKKKTTAAKRTSTRTTRTTTPAPSPETRIPETGMFTSGTEKQYRKGLVALSNGQYDEAVKVLEGEIANETSNISDDFLLGVALSKVGRPADAIATLERVTASDVALPDELMRKYAKNLSLAITVEIVPGVVIELPFDSAGAAALLAEQYQREGRLEDAAALMEGLGEAGLAPEVAAISLAELYFALRRWDEVARVTDAVPNTDDLSAATLMYRGAAFVEQGLYEAALIALKEALRYRKRAAPILDAAHYYRGRAYELQGDAVKARKEWEAVYASNPDFPDVSARLGMAS